jgi:hypothetical protein
LQVPVQKLRVATQTDRACYALTSAGTGQHLLLYIVLRLCKHKRGHKTVFGTST